MPYDRKDYNDRYYKLNRDIINAKKRKKYKLDREYRKACLDRAKRNYDRKHGRNGPRDRKVFTVDGDRYYTIGHICEIVGRKPSTIRTMIRQEIVPEATYIASNGWRLFSENQKNLITDIFQKYDKGEISKFKETTEYLKTHWEDD
jgi:hypothetical protein